MKKLIALLLCLAILMTGTACTIARSTNRVKSTSDTTVTTGAPTTVHTHQYDDGEIITPATCDQSGTKKYTCTDTNCGHSYTEAYELPTIPATELFNQAVKYVGEIVTYDKQSNELALGTGFVISSNGQIVTNYHVIEGAYSAGITIDGIKYTVASVLAYDPDIDLAVLKVNATGLTAATVCKKPVSAGAAIYAIGSSRGLTDTFSQGIVTYADRVIDGVSYVQHDASITHGNSGGPLLNSYGEVIGINTWGVSDSQNLNFAVFAAELDNLTYGSPLTMHEFYEQNLNAFDELIDFILEKGEYNSDRTIKEIFFQDGYNSSGTQYQILAFGYDEKNDNIVLDYYVKYKSSNMYFYTCIFLERNVDSYYYSFTVNDNGYTAAKMQGYIIPETFNDNTLVGYSSYEGASSLKSDVRESASLSTIYLIDYLELVCTNYLGLTVADFGFTIF